MSSRVSIQFLWGYDGWNKLVKSVGLFSDYRSLPNGELIHPGLTGAENHRDKNQISLLAQIPKNSSNLKKHFPKQWCSQNSQKLGRGCSFPSTSCTSRLLSPGLLLATESLGRTRWQMPFHHLWFQSLILTSGYPTKMQHGTQKVAFNRGEQPSQPHLAGFSLLGPQLLQVPRHPFGHTPCSATGIATAWRTSAWTCRARCHCGLVSCNLFERGYPSAGQIRIRGNPFPDQISSSFLLFWISTVSSGTNLRSKIGDQKWLAGKSCLTGNRLQVDSVDMFTLW